MTAKEELNQYKYARERVDETLEEYQRYKERAEKMTAIISDMPRGGVSSNKVEDNAVIMADLSKQYEERWIQAELEKLRIELKLDQVKEPYRKLLKKRYIQDLNFEKIADEMGYSYVRITHLHGEALIEYEKSTSHDKT